MTSGRDRESGGSTIAPAPLKDASNSSAAEDPQAIAAAARARHALSLGGRPASRASTSNTTAKS